VEGYEGNKIEKKRYINGPKSAESIRNVDQRLRFLGGGCGGFIHPTLVRSFPFRGQ